MDNITHTLVGVALGQAGLKRRSVLATATLVIGANLPDMDGFIYLFGSNTDALAFRRGWTHGVLAMGVLPLVLVAMMMVWDRLIRRRDHRVPPPVDLKWLLAVAIIAVWSHPLLDWLNTYGVRLLMPFSGRWFYGDALFIIDPWVWLVLGIGIGWSRGNSPRPAQIALGTTVGYACLMAAFSRVGRVAVERLAEGPAVTRVMVAPVFGAPFRRVVVRDLGAVYEEGSLTWAGKIRYTPTNRFPTGLDRPEMTQALATQAGARFLGWSRFPLVHTEPRGDSVRVMLSDLRYGSGRTGSFATVAITVAGAP